MGVVVVEVVSVVVVVGVRVVGLSANSCWATAGRVVVAEDETAAGAWAAPVAAGIVARVGVADADGGVVAAVVGAGTVVVAVAETIAGVGAAASMLRCFSNVGSIRCDRVPRP